MYIYIMVIFQKPEVPCTTALPKCSLHTVHQMHKSPHPDSKTLSNVPLTNLPASTMCTTKEPPHCSQTNLILHLLSSRHPDYQLPPSLSVLTWWKGHLCLFRVFHVK